MARIQTATATTRLDKTVCQQLPARHGSYLSHRFSAQHSRSNWIFPPTESFQLESGKEVDRAILFTAQDYAPLNWSRHKDPKFWDSVHLYIDSVRERGETANGSKRRRTIKAESNKRSIATATFPVPFCSSLALPLWLVGRTREGAHDT